MTRWETLARRIVTGAAIAAAALLALGMLLSYAGLRSAYLGAGFPEWAASAAPLTVDLLTLVAYVGLLVLAGKVYPSAVVAFGVLASAGAQGYHLSHGGVDAKITDGRVIFLLGASCMVFAGLSGHLLWRILERALPAGFITAMQDQSQDRAVLGWRQDGTPVPVHLPTAPEAGYSTGAWAALHPAADLERQLADWTAERPLDPIPPRLTEPTRLAAVPDPIPGPAAPFMPEAYAGPNGQMPSRPDPIPAAHAAERTRRPSVDASVAPSQATGPCVPTCKHHTGPVSKSTRYRCGPSGNCPACHPKESTSA